MLAGALARMLGQSPTGVGLFRSGRTAFRREEGELVRYEVGDPQVEVIMDSVEALFAFQLVELLTMISAEVPGVFEPHGTARRLQALSSAEMGRLLRLGLAPVYFDANYGSTSHENSRSEGGALTDVGKFVEGKWDLLALKIANEGYYQELLKLVYRILWQLESQKYLLDKALYYPHLGSAEETRMLSGQSLEERRAARSQEAGQPVSEIETMPYESIVWRMMLTEQGRLRRNAQFLTTIKQLYKDRPLDRAGVQVGATLLYIIEQIDGYLRVNNSMNIRVKGMNTTGLETLAAHDILGETFEHRFLEDVTEEQLSYGLPSEQVHPIGYLMFVMLAEIRSDLFDQYDALIEKFEEYKRENMRDDLRVAQVPAARYLDGDEESQPFYTTFSVVALLESKNGGTTKQSYMARPYVDGANRREAYEREMRDDTAEHSLLRPTLQDLEMREELLRTGKARDTTVGVPAIVRRRNLDRVAVGDLQPVDMGFEDPQALAFLLTHNRTVAMAQDILHEASKQPATVQHPDPKELAAVDPKDEQLYMKKRPGALTSVEVDLWKCFSLENGLDPDAMPPELPKEPTPEEIVEAVQGSEPETTEEMYEHARFYTHDDDPRLAYVTAKVIAASDGGAANPNYASIRNPKVFPPLAPKEYETKQRKAQRQAYEEKMRKDLFNRGRRVDRGDVEARVIAEENAKRQAAERRAELQRAGDIARGWKAMASVQGAIDAGREQLLERERASLKRKKGSKGSCRRGSRSGAPAAASSAEPRRSPSPVASSSDEEAGGGSEADSQVVLREEGTLRRPSYAISSDDEDGDEGSPEQTRAAPPVPHELRNRTGATTGPERMEGATGVVAGSRRPLA